MKGLQRTDLVFVRTDTGLACAKLNRGEDTTSVSPATSGELLRVKTGLVQAKKAV